MQREALTLIYTTQYTSPIGNLLLAGTDTHLAGVWMEGQKYFPGFLQDETMECSNTPILGQTKQWLDRYFAGEQPSIRELSLAPAGTVFRKEVWKILCEIPYGQVISYGEIAQKIAACRGLDHMSAQAVGGAVGHNPISIIIPCHRVVGCRGSLTGYAGGLQKKISLLIHEGVDMERLFIPTKERAFSPVLRKQTMH